MQVNTETLTAKNETSVKTATGRCTLFSQLLVWLPLQKKFLVTQNNTNKHLQCLIRTVYSILIYATEWSNVHMIHWNKLLSHTGKEFPHFNFLECCSLSNPKLWTSKGNSDYNRTKSRSSDQIIWCFLSQKSVPHKLQVMKLQATRTPQIHSMCSAGSVHIWTACLPGA